MPNLPILKSIKKDYLNSAARHANIAALPEITFFADIKPEDISKRICHYNRSETEWRNLAVSDTKIPRLRSGRTNYTYSIVLEQLLKLKKNARGDAANITNIANRVNIARIAEFRSQTLSIRR